MGSWTVDAAAGRTDDRVGDRARHEPEPALPTVIEMEVVEPGEAIGAPAPVWSGPPRDRSRGRGLGAVDHLGGADTVDVSIDMSVEMDVVEADLGDGGPGAPGSRGAILAIVACVASLAVVIGIVIADDRGAGPQERDGPPPTAPPPDALEPPPPGDPAAPGSPHVGTAPLVPLHPDDDLTPTAPPRPLHPDDRLIPTAPLVWLEPDERAARAGPLEPGAPARSPTPAGPAPADSRSRGSSADPAPSTRPDHGSPGFPSPLPNPKADVGPGTYTSDLLGVQMSIVLLDEWRLERAVASTIQLVDPGSSPVESGLAPRGRELLLQRIDGWYARSQSADTLGGTGEIPANDVAAWAADNDVVVDMRPPTTVDGRPAQVFDAMVDPRSELGSGVCAVDDRPCVFATSVSARSVRANVPSTHHLATGRVHRYWLVDLGSADPLLLRAATSVDDAEWIDEVEVRMVTFLALGPPAPPVSAG